MPLDPDLGGPAEEALSRALQESLLTEPSEPDHLTVTVRYRAASVGHRIGGDWHDSFLMPSGALSLSIGDVAGHGVEAAVTMAHIRSVLRGIQVAAPEAPPSRMLSTLDEALETLGLANLATAVVARVEQTPGDERAGLRRLRWSNAGHPAPVLVAPDGTPSLLSTTPERLLGTSYRGRRSDHVVLLEPGATVVFYTDGLVERRRAVIDDGIAALLERLRGTSTLAPEALGDRLLEDVETAHDDIALLVLRANPERPVPTSGVSRAVDPGAPSTHVPARPATGAVGPSAVAADAVGGAAQRRTESRAAALVAAPVG